MGCGTTTELKLINEEGSNVSCDWTFQKQTTSGQVTNLIQESRVTNESFTRTIDSSGKTTFSCQKLDQADTSEIEAQIIVSGKVKAQQKTNLPNPNGVVTISHTPPELSG